MRSLSASLSRLFPNNNTLKVKQVQHKITESTKEDASPIKTNTKQLKLVDNVDESLIGRYCMVLYDGLPYPGVIVAVDEDDIEVKTLTKIGRNRWFWPRRDDVLWYKSGTVVTLLDEEPVHVTNRHHKISDDMWELVENVLP